MSKHTKQPQKTSKVEIDSPLAKGLCSLEPLAGAPEGIGVTERSPELDLGKSKTSRLLQSLTTLGYVEPTDSKAYFSTKNVRQVGQQVIGNLNLPELARLQMLVQSRETREATYLAVPDGLSVLYNDKVVF